MTCWQATDPAALLQVPVLYEQLDPKFYMELEARVEEVLRDALYGGCLPGCGAVRL